MEKNKAERSGLKGELEKSLNRPITLIEEENMFNDALLLAQYAYEKIAALELRIAELEKK